jgi:glycosyltransferase involved in cell wall biosynthesis
VSASENPRFSIITPSFRASEWLNLCIASVHDQGVPLEHIVQDAGSDDGTLDWLPSDSRVNAFIEKDEGMYDALNRGLRRAKGDLVGYLNCDEQYLPGTLKHVEGYFAAHPRIDMVFGDVVVTSPDGSYRFHRRMQTPLLYHTWTVQLSTLSCGMFFRRSSLLQKNLFFDTSWKAAGDGEWMVRVRRRGLKMAALRRFTSAFTLTGGNLGQSTRAHEENRQLCQSAPAWAQLLRPGFIAHHRLRRFIGGMYFQKPFSYEIFTRASPGCRTQFHVSNPRSRSV